MVTEEVDSLNREIFKQNILLIALLALGIFTFLNSAFLIARPDELASTFFAAGCLAIKYFTDDQSIESRIGQLRILFPHLEGGTVTTFLFRRSITNLDNQSLKELFFSGLNSLFA